MEKINKWRDRKSYLLHKEPTGCTPPPHPQLNLMSGPQCQAESRGVMKNLSLVGTITMSVALVRHMFHYLSSSSVTTGT